MGLLCYKNTIIFLIFVYDMDVVFSASKLLKIFEDLMGKRPALEIEIMMIN